MGYTVDQLTAVEAAIATGELTVEFTGPGGTQKITYRSMADLMQARDLIRAELVASGAMTVPARVSYASFTKD